MESISSPSHIHIHLHHTNLISPSTNPSLISFPYRWFFKPLLPNRFCGLKASGDGGGGSDGDLLRKPAVEVKEDASEEDDGEKRREDGWIDWEDQILEDTVPLVGFVRMILHSGKYASGERLSPEHESTILERLLPYHPESQKKIGCGISYITVGYHPDFESSRCLFIVRKDGEMEDFSYWKCIKGLIRKKYPLYADNFILRHFRRRRHND
ncbi:protein DCL, chloroplastic-like [Bidens hawaiensis]|uniref:protein DCL, chloroplastic-like n=1 Tax=Bidens hawaiensis TaxID=980011 RepID=UPI004049C885